MPDVIELEPDVEVFSFPDVATAKDWMVSFLDHPPVREWRFAWANEPGAVSEYLTKMNKPHEYSLDITVCIAGREAKLGLNYIP